MIIYGRNTLRQLLESGIGVSQLSIVHSAKGDGIKEIIRMAKARKLFIHYVENKIADKICGAGAVHQGVYAEIDTVFLQNRTEFFSLNENQNFILALDQISDPHNIGAIIRSAEILGVTRLILSDKNTASINATVAKVSSGALFYMKIYQSSDLDYDLVSLKNLGYQILVADSNAQISVDDIDTANPKKVLIIGNEGTGIRKSTKEIADILFKIPMRGKTDSFNASVAAAISLYSLNKN